MNQINDQNATVIQQEFTSRSRSERRAVILAAGAGIRTTPMRRDIPKGLIEIAGERLIERLILQLKEAGVHSIDVVIGYEGKRYQYLSDEFDVQLIENPFYLTKNNLYSLSLAADKLENCFILPCDIWLKDNPFLMNDAASWYLVSGDSDASNDDLFEDAELLSRTMENLHGYAMVGVAYMDVRCGSALRNTLLTLAGQAENDGLFWESALTDSTMPRISAKMIHATDYIEINTYEDLRRYSQNPEQLESKVLDVITGALSVTREQISSIQLMKKGMTNRSFTFVCGLEQYIMRIPGEGTNHLIDRSQEFHVYQCVNNGDITDEVLYFNPENGYKLSKYWIDSRVCDPSDEADLSACMRFLRAFHEKAYSVDHAFDIFERIDFYESLRAGEPSIHSDYSDTKQRVFLLRPLLEKYAEPACLTHIDAVPDNFLLKDGKIRLIDWEYAGMADPHVDIAMFIIYSLYDKSAADRLIDLYFTEGCKPQVRAKIYGYIAACGLLWSNWCEFKRMQGVRFGEYEDMQFGYAREYCAIAMEAMAQAEG